MNNHFYIFTTSIVLFIVLLTGCAGKRHVTSTEIPATPQQWALYLFDSSDVHSGLYMVEAGIKPDQFDPIIDYNSSSLFTPASNTKILTLYTALKLLPDTLTGFRWLQRHDTTFIRGTGDPGFLDSRFDSSARMAFLHSQNHLVFVSDWSQDNRWGPGWSWDDYPYYYAAQKSPFPVYGNVTTAWCQNGTWSLKPDGFIQNIVSQPGSPSVRRHETANIFQMNKDRCSRDTLHIPYVWTPSVAVRLLRDTLGQPVNFVRSLPYDQDVQWSSIAGTERDTLLRAMMYDSDNLIAEQLLVNAAAQHWNSLESEKVIDSLISTDFNQWQDRIRWVDGSGLSVYNKFSPRFLVNVLSGLYASMSSAELLKYFAAGGVRGTISSWYGNEDGSPYVFAKTGTLSGVHCLSGYLIADSGRNFIFSFMHNNYVGSSGGYKERMEILLQWIKKYY